MGWAAVIVAGLRRLLGGAIATGRTAEAGETDIVSWPMVLIAISTTGIWVTMMVVNLKISPTENSNVVVIDTTCQSNYDALYEKHLILQQKYAKTEDSLLYERNLRLTPAAAAGAIEKRYQRK